MSIKRRWRDSNLHNPLFLTINSSNPASHNFAISLSVAPNVQFRNPRQTNNEYTQYLRSLDPGFQTSATAQKGKGELRSPIINAEEVETNDLIDSISARILVSKFTSSLMSLILKSQWAVNNRAFDSYGLIEHQSLPTGIYRCVLILRVFTDQWREHGIPIFGEIKRFDLVPSTMSLHLVYKGAWAALKLLSSTDIPLGILYPWGWYLTQIFSGLKGN